MGRLWIWLISKPGNAIIEKIADTYPTTLSQEEILSSEEEDRKRREIAAYMEDENEDVLDCEDI